MTTNGSIRKEEKIKAEIELLKTKKHQLVLKRLTTPFEIENTMSDLSLTAMSTGFLTFINPIENLQFINYSPILIEFLHILKKIKNMSKKYTEEYFEALKLYKSYISGLSHIFKSNGINNSMVATLVFNNFFQQGLFSDESWATASLDSFYNTKEQGFQELYGSKTLGEYTPYSNHYSSMLADLLNEMGYNACTLIGNADLSFYYKAFTGIVDNNQKFAYDPIDSEFLFFDSKYKIHSINKDGTIKQRYELFDKYARQNNSNILREKQYKILKKAPIKTFDNKEFFKNLLEADNKTEDLTETMKAFKDVNKTRVKKINELNSSFK